MYDETDDDDNTNDDYNETIETNEDDVDDDDNNDDGNDDNDDDGNDDDNDDDGNDDDNDDDGNDDDNDDDGNDDDNDDDENDDDNDDDKDGDDDDNDDVHSRSPERTTPTSVQLHHRSSLIDAMDLAVDLRIKAFCGPLQLRHKLAVQTQSSPEINILPPQYGEVNTIPQVQTVLSKMTEIPSRPARRSVWKRSKRRVWKCFVNVARRICFCQSIVNVE
ncbi:pheromone-processing carboxypeptidase KEX1-like [Myzus persicae]|uniref:pheromone-processing carboxypeptidase KEX1-like n=1 Tax=Myzus persicae TaxID=13164 RepID=UPI000B9384F3|nr:pheromone-processing carboxypeptidase KEX1-like [Myzus persicae]